MEKKALLDITVTPKSSMSKITIGKDKAVKVYLNSPPAEGKANEECIRLFSKKLGIAKSFITIEKGEKSRKKRILIPGLSNEEVISIILKN
jgi:uncharacterized protein